MKKILSVVCFATVLLYLGIGFAADVVPDVIMMPGTQPQEVTNFETPDKCDNCHNADPGTMPGFGWRGAAMGNAGRDPIFWSTLAIAEQDFDGAGDLCIRCHSAGGWIAGRSTPTDGSGLNQNDSDGIDCETCHRATNPDNTEYGGVMYDPFIANQDDLPFGPLPEGATEGYYGSGILSYWEGSHKLGPYGDAEARHQFKKSSFHRDVDFCGMCHDVSNSAVGHLAPNAGTLDGAQPVTKGEYYQGLGYPLDPNVAPNDPNNLDSMVAFNNPPYAFGIVERTFSEFKSSPFGTDEPDPNAEDGLKRILVKDFSSLPEDLQAPGGAFAFAYNQALLAGKGGNYEDDEFRYFSCQTCHMYPVVGYGCDKKNAPLRKDLPMHDQTGGNYWVMPLVKYQDAMETLRLGGNLTDVQIAAMDAGTERAKASLERAASLTVDGDTLKITNLTGHKLITGYPEGRRMFVNVKWYDVAEPAPGQTPIREDGAYGPLGVTFQYVDANGVTKTFEPQSILDLEDTQIYEAQPAMSQAWAQTLRVVDTAILGVDYYGPKDLGFNRMTGASVGSIQDLAEGTIPGHAETSYYKTFHFVLNNYMANDNRIPPYQMDYNEALRRNASPVPQDQYGGAPDGNYEHWDTVPLDPPPGAVRGDITLYYQGTSWEYVQFMWLENDMQNEFLGMEGVNFLDAWVNADEQYGAIGTMVPPYPMATATWGDVCTPGPEGPYGHATCTDEVDNDCDGLTDAEDPDCDPPMMACSDYRDKGACNADPDCEWQGKGGSGTCVDYVAPDCSSFNSRKDCRNAGCSWTDGMCTAP
jgi:hypothetical protein